MASLTAEPPRAQRLVLGLVTTLLAAACVIAVRAEPAQAVSAFPSPGTDFASARTQISFRGVVAAGLGPIQVVGSRTGRHDGRLLDHSDGQGVSFLPTERFRGGERVTVRTGLSVLRAVKGDFHFSVARVPARPPPPAINAPPSNQGRHDVQRFRSRPDLRPPNYRILRRRPGTAPGHIFLAPKKGSGQNGPMILDRQGRMVYFRPTPSRRQRAADFRVQRYQGAPVLTFWRGLIQGGQGAGEGVILDSAYTEIARVRAGNGYAADLHEFVVTPRNTALILVYSPAYKRVRIRGRGRRALLIDSIVQEIDIPTGLVMYEWHSLGRVGMDESRFRRPGTARIPWDYFHVNAVSEDSDGHLLVTARHTWAVYKISRQTGRIIWRLGGRSSDFKMSPETRFAWPHDGHREADGTISVFDNAASPAVRKHSRAINISLNRRKNSASLTRAIEHPAGLLSGHQGNAYTLPNGNVFVGWGGARWFSEFTASGRMLFDARLAKGNDTYRAYRAPWTGQPRNRPRIAARTVRGGRVDVYASWNGATEVARWRILAGPDPGSLAPVGVGDWTGFETRVRVSTGARHVAAQALDGGGQVLRTSRAEQPK